MVLNEPSSALSVKASTFMYKPILTLNILLINSWGLLDIDDCYKGAESLADQGKADRGKLFIDGGSAGGFAALASITFHGDVFSAGTSFYGVCDLTALAASTHKFESRYLDTLIGPLPGAQEIYDERSPIKHVDKLDCAVCIFQGLEDKVRALGQRKRGLIFVGLLCIVTCCACKIRACTLFTFIFQQ